MIERNHIYKMDCRDGLQEMARGGGGYALIALSPTRRTLSYTQPTYRRIKSISFVRPYRTTTTRN